MFGGRKEVPTSSISGGSAPSAEVVARRAANLPSGDERSSSTASRWNTQRRAGGHNSNNRVAGGSARERVELTKRTMLFLAMPFVCYVVWLTPIFAVGFAHVEEACDRPLVPWLFGWILMMGAFMVFYIGIITYAWKHVNPDSRVTKVIDVCWEILEKTIILASLLYCFLGAIWLIQTSDCHDKMPHVYNLTLAIVITFLAIPAFYLTTRITLYCCS